MANDPLQPSAALLCKIGSALVHAEEMTEPGTHAFDAAAFQSLLEDPDVIEWREGMDTLALLPKKRNADV